MFIPLGLALKLRNFPFITWLIIATCFGYYFSAQQKEMELISTELKKTRDNKELIITRGNLFVEYCLDQNLGMSEELCKKLRPKTKEIEALEKEEKVKNKDKNRHKRNKDINFSELFDQGVSILSLSSNFQKDLKEENNNVIELASYQKYKELVDAQKDKILSVHKKYDLLSAKNFSLWAIFKATFSHSNFMHLFGNMMMFFIFGRYVEDKIGHLNFLGIYLIGGCLAMGAYALTFIEPGIFVVGASANVSVIMGLFYILFFDFRMKFWVWYFVTRTFSLNIKFYFFFFYIATDFIFTFTGTSNVAHAAHAFGLLIGIATARAIISRENLPKYFLHVDEYTEWLAIKKATKASEVVSISHKILTHNPYNKTVRTYFFKKLLGGENAHNRTYTPELYHYLVNQLATLAENSNKKNEISEFLKILTQFPDRYGINPIFKKLDQKKIITLINHAIDTDKLFMALRLIVVYIEKYPRSQKNHNLMRTLQSILENIQDRERLSHQLAFFINKITNLKLKTLLSPFIQGEANA